MKEIPCTDCDVANCFINIYCSQIQQEEITNGSTFTHYETGQLIFKDGDKVVGMFFIHSGKVMIYNGGSQEENILSVWPERRYFGPPWIWWKTVLSRIMQ